MMNLLNCYLPVFRFISEFTLNPHEHTDYAQFRKRSIEILQASLLRSELHYAQQECDDAYFAVVIWLDERVLCSSLEWVKKWRCELLQNQFFNISVGGAEFFTRLDSIDKTNTQLKMVYLFCLLMGFHGKYTWEDPILLKQRIEDERFALPPEWQTWPNEAKLIEQDFPLSEGLPSVRKKLRHRKWLMLSFIVVVYMAMLSSGVGLFNRF